MAEKSGLLGYADEVFRRTYLETTLTFKYLNACYQTSISPVNVGAVSYFDSPAIKLPAKGGVARIKRYYMGLLAVEAPPSNLG